MLASAWLTAAATGLLALFAVVTAWYARKAFREQSKEVSLLQEQALHEQQDFRREAEERRRRQAAQVFVWVEPRPFSPAEIRPAVCVRNTSSRPVYQVSVFYGESGAGGFDMLLPGADGEIPGAGSAVVDGSVPLSIEFRDAAGLCWRASSRGQLLELDSNHHLPASPPTVSS